MAIYEFLSFDSQLFGFPVAKIIPERMTSPNLLAALNELKDKGIKLVYWCSDRSDKVSQLAAQEAKGLLTDEKVTYLVSLADVKNKLTGVVWEVYDESNALPTQELIELSFSVANNSRFSKDNLMPVDLRNKMYEQWIVNSCNRTIAKEVFVTREENHIIGMVTAGEKNGRGDIGLLAVNSNYLGRGLGVKLVRMAQAYFYKNNFKQVQVVTQKDNIAACKLYEKCDFKLEKIQNFYHFWLS